MAIVFLRDIYKRKKYFLNSTRLFFDAREKINHFKSRIFPIQNLDGIATPQPAPEPTIFARPKPTKKETKNSSLNCIETFENKIVNMMKEI